MKDCDWSAHIMLASDWSIPEGQVTEPGTTGTHIGHLSGIVVAEDCDWLISIMMKSDWSIPVGVVYHWTLLGQCQVSGVERSGEL